MDPLCLLEQIAGSMPDYKIRIARWHIISVSKPFGKMSRYEGLINKLGMGQAIVKERKPMFSSSFSTILSSIQAKADVCPNSDNISQEELNRNAHRLSSSGCLERLCMSAGRAMIPCKKRSILVRNCVRLSLPFETKTAKIPIRAGKMRSSALPKRRKYNGNSQGH
ncbi:MAG: hypothetical protein A3F90_09485 [Deltaproteobacteria bacterium RIFCSPLOWO2_12_FULL_60_19]|nr:MAG: hypothetical protein A3F90_09485 [Deltaproteobacteria bacterium RIFCSPLOWO2_12_FULL_60_19]